MIWYVSQSDSITWPIAAKLSDVSANIALQDLKVLAEVSGPALIKRKNEEKGRHAADVYVKAQDFFR